ncbi:MAG: class I SAM-dependent methyltransferase [Pseudomonadota bacterium]
MSQALDLTGVPETMLWPLWNRAVEQQRADRLIDDPLARRLIDRIDYDFPGHFGRPSVYHAIRARVADDWLRDHIASGAGDPVVISLGDGLETQPWRLNDPQLRWYSVDVPEAMAVRQRLLPEHPQSTQIPSSALDTGWMDQVEACRAPFISAAGLLMYFSPAAVRQLLQALAARYPGAGIFFDTIPPWFSRKTLKGLRVTARYTAPPMPWGIGIDDIEPFLSGLKGLSVGAVQTYADPFPRRTRVISLLSYLKFLRRHLAAGLVLAKANAPT